MKKSYLVVLWAAAAVLLCTGAYAQDDFAPANPQDVGVTPLTDTVLLNEDVANESLESIGIDITADEKVIVGWEDDPSGIEAGIRMFDINLTNMPWANDAEGNNASSYYNDDGTPMTDDNAWGPKVKANWYGEGFGMGAVAYGVNSGLQSGSAVPAVQLYEADGTPIIPIRAGVNDAYAIPDGNGIRIGDWCYLTNGSIAIAGEDRQPEAVEGGQKQISLAILGPDDVLPTEVLLASNGEGYEMWHGVAPLANGCVLRYRGPNGVTIRYFDNAGAPTTDELDLSAFGSDFNAGVMTSGGRGDHEGIDSDADNRVILATKANLDGFEGNEVYAMVFDGAGNEVVAPILVSGDAAAVVAGEGGEGGYNFTNASNVDGAIGPDGSFIVVWADADPFGSDRIQMARVFNPDGTPAPPIFTVDSRYSGPDWEQLTGQGRQPRVVWRGNKIGIIWESDVDQPVRTLVGRIFEYGEVSVDSFMLY